MSSCAPRSSARPTASSRCSPARTGGSARSARGCAGPSPSSAPGSSRSPTSTSSCTPAGRWTSSPRSRRSTAFGAGMAGDYARYTAGTAMLETAERLTAEEHEPAVQQYLLLVGGLRALAGRRARPGHGARRLPAPFAGGGRLRAALRRLRAVRCRGTAPGLLHLRRRVGVPGLPPARLGRARPGDARRCSPRCSAATGRSPRPPSRATAARAPGSSPRTCSGTWSVGCARCRWWSATGPAEPGEPAPSRRTSAEPAPERRPAAAIAADQVPRHVAVVMDGNGRWANAARPAAHGRSRGRRGGAVRRRRGRDRDRRRGSCRRTRSPPRTGGARRTRSASSWASTGT